jgi:hypothetical protein
MKNKMLIITFVTVFFSCNKTKSPNEFFWGEINYYDDCLFKKFEAEIMEKTLDFEFNEDAVTLLGNNVIEFELIKKDDKGNYTAADNIHVYVDGEKCENNIIKITPRTKSITLGLTFANPKEAKEGHHAFNLKVKDPGGLTRIDNIEITNRSQFFALSYEWVIKKNNIMNPRATILFFLLTGLTVLILLWKFVIVLSKQTFKIPRIEIKYPDSEMASERKKIKGCVKVVCTNKVIRQSSVCRFFAGKILYVKNVFFTEPVTVLPKNKGRTVSVFTDANHIYSIFPRSTQLNGEPIQINKGKEVTSMKVIN